MLYLMIISAAHHIRQHQKSLDMLVYTDLANARQVTDNISTFAPRTSTSPLLTLPTNTSKYASNNKARSFSRCNNGRKAVQHRPPNAMIGPNRSYVRLSCIAEAA